MQTKQSQRRAETATVTRQRNAPESVERRMPSEEEIRERACQIFMARTFAGQSGDELSDWLQVERELRQPSNETPRRIDH